MFSLRNWTTAALMSTQEAVSESHCIGRTLTLRSISLAGDDVLCGRRYLNSASHMLQEEVDWSNKRFKLEDILEIHNHYSP